MFLVEGECISLSSIAKAAKIILVTPATTWGLNGPAPEAIRESFYQTGQAWNNRRLHDETFEMLVMAQHSTVQHGGEDLIEVSIFSVIFVVLIVSALHCP